MRMKIGFIGAGKVGFTLGKYFREQGVEVTGYCSRSIQSAKEAANFTHTAVYSSPEEVLSKSDVLFFTVPDDAVKGCYEQLDRALLAGKILCHTSGAMTAQEGFPDIEAHVAFGYSVHPLFAISDKQSAYKEMAGVFFALEGSRARLQEMQNWLQGLGLFVQQIKAASKGKYHAAAAIVSNQVTALFAQAQEMFAQCGFSQDTARQALSGLFVGNAVHVATDGPVAALTGPVQRGDTGTLDKHLAVLDAREDKLLYVLLSRKLARLAKEKNPAYDEAAMEKFLTERELAI